MACPGAIFLTVSSKIHSRHSHTLLTYMIITHRNECNHPYSSNDLAPELTHYVIRMNSVCMTLDVEICQTQAESGKR